MASGKRRKKSKPSKRISLKGAPLPNFKHIPNNKQRDSKLVPSWYYSTPRTINNPNIPSKLRKFETR